MTAVFDVETVIDEQTRDELTPPCDGEDGEDCALPAMYIVYIDRACDHLCDHYLMCRHHKRVFCAVGGECQDCGATSYVKSVEPLR